MGGISVAASLGGFEDIRDEVERFVAGEGLPDGTGFSLCLVLEELIVNIVTHGYGGRRGPVVLSLDADGARVTGEIVDEGVPFDPTASPDVDTDATLEERDIGGLGVHLVRSMVEDFGYTRDGMRNVVRFSLPIANGRSESER